MAPSLRARCDAAQALDRMSAAYAAQFGEPIKVTDAYRDFAGQQSAKASWCARGKCNMAATPGTSNHGWALAFDLGEGINSYDTAPYAWMKNHGSEFGFFHPTWAEPGHKDYAKSEPWHWQYLPDADPSKP
nr:M15 family metallopeptidase [Cellulomonas sp. RIT-PI-Y]